MKVPEVRGRNPREAREILEQRRLEMERAGWVCSPLSAARTVVRQEPVAGASVRLNSTVRVWVSAELLSAACTPWLAGGGLLAGLIIWLILKIFGNGKQPPEPPQPEPESPAAAKITYATNVDPGDQTIDPDKPQSSLELQLRFQVDPGVQEIEAAGPLIKEERREHE